MKRIHNNAEAIPGNENPTTITESKYTSTNSQPNPRLTIQWETEKHQIRKKTLNQLKRRIWILGKSYFFIRVKLMLNI